MSGNKGGEETFLAKFYVGNRVTIPESIREFLGIELHDTLRVTVRIERKAGD